MILFSQWHKTRTKNEKTRQNKAHEKISYINTITDKSLKKLKAYKKLILIIFKG